jgi:vacuolar-type H+-ATPase subunit B/Vma2
MAQQTPEESLDHHYKMVDKSYTDYTRAFTKAFSWQNLTENKRQEGKFLIELQLLAIKYPQSKLARILGLVIE